jgi:hypothetical protein
MVMEYPNMAVRKIGRQNFSELVGASELRRKFPLGARRTDKGLKNMTIRAVNQDMAQHATECCIDATNAGRFVWPRITVK